MAKILIIEDEQLVADTIEVLLMKAGHDITLANNGKAGLAAFAADRPDLVITDIIMPEMQGVDVIKELRAQAPDIPIIAMSGGGRTRNFDFLRIADKVGATEVLRKPYSNDELLKMVARCLKPAGAG